MPRPLLGLVLAAYAALMLIVGWVEYFAPTSHDRFGITFAPAGSDAVVVAIKPDVVVPPDLRVGDVVLISQMSMSSRMRLYLGISPAGTTMRVPVVRDGRYFSVNVTSRSRHFSASNIQGWIVYGSVSTFTLLILGIVAWRRPSIATAALLFYGSGTLTTARICGLGSWLPDPLFGGYCVAVSLLADAPIFGLIVFVTRFPRVPESPQARLRMRVGDALAAVLTVVSLLETVFEPLLYKSWEWLTIVLTVAGCIAVLIFAAFALTEASGDDRRRIGWVIAGIVVSVCSAAAFNVIDATTSLSAGNALGTVVTALNIALPVALAYAVLRHRVIDLGFAVNRTIVYGAILAVVVVMVGLVDWLTGKLIGRQKLADVVEAALTVAIGFGLSYVHNAIERLVDRIIFRKRHIAEKRIDHRIDALDFSESEAAVDEALAHDAPSFLELSTAAVFRRRSPGPSFVRTASEEWDAGTAESFDPDTILVRTMRAMERPIFLDDVAIVLEDVPSGARRPMLAIPIVTQHELFGFVLYGYHRDGSSPDPGEVAILLKLARAAGTAYANVESRRWRERAAVLEGSLVRAAHA